MGRKSKEFEDGQSRYRIGRRINREKNERRQGRKQGVRYEGGQVRSKRYRLSSRLGAQSRDTDSDKYDEDEDKIGLESE